MSLQVFLAASLRKYFPGYDGATGIAMELEAGNSVADVAEKLGIPLEEVRLIMVNGIGSKWETKLEGNERVALFPPVGGG